MVQQVLQYRLILRTMLQNIVKYYTTRISLLSPAESDFNSFYNDCRMFYAAFNNIQRYMTKAVDAPLNNIHLTIF